MKRYFLPNAMFLRQLPKKEEAEEEAEEKVEVVTNEFAEKKVGAVKKTKAPKKAKKS